jgi:lysozyme
MADPFNGVIDISHHNDRPDLGRAKRAGIVGVFQKATQGEQFVDPTFATNRTNARAAGLLWGVYHFGTGGDGTLQADHFLTTVQPDAQTLLVLDLEANPQGPNMPLIEARAFVTHVREVTGRWPGLYSGHYIKALLDPGKDPILANCWFWLAQYGPTAVLPANWPTWTFWQYTDGALGPEPHSVDGVGRCDRDRFNGTEADLRAFWAASST